MNVPPPMPRRSFVSPSGASIHVFADVPSAAVFAADRIASLIRGVSADRGRVVLGLATGGTPIPVYEHLVALHRAENLSFSRATTYNLDEYYPISPLDPNSYRSYMHRHLFSHVDLPPHHAHVLDGTVPEAFAASHCSDFDRWIAADGGLDLQLLGIGRNGHIGFNEPTDLDVETALKLPTRPVSLHPTTTLDAARDFGGDPGLVPRRALTMGVAPILSARSILVLAFGSSKADAVRRSLEGGLTAEVPGSLLRTAGERVTWVVDEAAIFRYSQEDRRYLPR